MSVFLCAAEKTTCVQRSGNSVWRISWLGCQYGGLRCLSCACPVDLTLSMARRLAAVGSGGSLAWSSCLTFPVAQFRGSVARRSIRPVAQSGWLAWSRTRRAQSGGSCLRVVGPWFSFALNASMLPCSWWSISLGSRCPLPLGLVLLSSFFLLPSTVWGLRCCILLNEEPLYWVFLSGENRSSRCNNQRKDTEHCQPVELPGILCSCAQLAFLRS